MTNFLTKIGEDVAGFRDKRLRGTTYLDKWRVSFIRNVATKLAE